MTPTECACCGGPFFPVKRRAWYTRRVCPTWHSDRWYPFCGTCELQGYPREGAASYPVEASELIDQFYGLESLYRMGEIGLDEMQRRSAALIERIERLEVRR